MTSLISTLDSRGLMMQIIITSWRKVSRNGAPSAARWPGSLARQHNGPLANFKPLVCQLPTEVSAAISICSFTDNQFQYLQFSSCHCCLRVWHCHGVGAQAAASEMVCISSPLPSGSVPHTISAKLRFKVPGGKQCNELRRPHQPGTPVMTRGPG